MAQLSWGKPTIEFAECNGAEALKWKSIGYDPVEGSTKLTPTKGEKKEAKVEGGEVEAVKYAKSTFAFEFEVRAAKGRTKPITDLDGVIEGEYAFRLTPEDPECEGILIERSIVSLEETFDAAEGKKWKYTVDVLKPAGGKAQVQSYFVEKEEDPVTPEAGK